MLKNKVIAVFGGGRGIGKSIALEAAKHGALIAVSARSEKEVQDVCSEAGKLYDSRTLAMACDVTNEKSVGEFTARVERELGPIDGLVCAAGVYGAIGPVETTPPSEWRQAIEVNVMGAYNCIYSAIPSMKKHKKGQIVLFSGGGQNAIPNFSSYLASKGAVWRMTETLGVELLPFGITVNAIAPGLVNTKFLDDLLAAGPDRVGKELYEKSVKQKQEGGIPPEQAAELVLWLLSGESGSLSGKIISARWDNFRAITDPSRYNQSDIFTVKRVTNFDGGTRF